MFARFVMDRDYLTAGPLESMAVAQWKLQTSPHRTIFVVDAGGRFLGLSRWSTVRSAPSRTIMGDVMEPRDSVVTIDPDADIAPLFAVFTSHADWPSVPVVDAEGVLCGIVTRDVPVPDLSPAKNYDESVESGLLARHVLDALQSGFLVVDANGMIRQLNRYGAELLGLSVDHVLGQPYEELAQYVFPHMQDYLRHSLVPAVFTTGAIHGEREFRIVNGRHVRFFYGTVYDGGALIAIIITFVDITALRRAESTAQETAREAESAFGLALPNTKVEAKLKASPEYQDVYDPATGLATVTGVIPDGTYWHVINGLRLMAELKAIGVFQLVGIDKDTMVQAFIFHDLGKEQPRLAIGETFVPSETFEPGRLHAARSADWAAREYHVTADVEALVRYHHTQESALPETFPAALKPMWRLFRLIDGLSAGITRREATVAPIALNGTLLTIEERNVDQRYHRAYTLSIYSGKESPVI